MQHISSFKGKAIHYNFTMMRLEMFWNAIPIKAPGSSKEGRKEWGKKPSKPMKFYNRFSPHPTLSPNYFVRAWEITADHAFFFSVVFKITKFGTHFLF